MNQFQIFFTVKHIFPSDLLIVTRCSFFPKLQRLTTKHIFCVLRTSYEKMNKNGDKFRNCFTFFSLSWTFCRFSDIFTKEDHHRKRRSKKRRPPLLAVVGFCITSFQPKQWRFFEEILRSRLSLTLGWPEILSRAFIVPILNRWAWPELFVLSLLCVFFSENKWVRGSFLLTNRSLWSEFWFKKETE